MPYLIGSGFCATPETLATNRAEWLNYWLPNTRKACSNIVVVDNAPAPGVMQADMSYRIVRVEKNLGHMSAPARHAGRFAGWSVSWILPALVAYSEGLDFIYKEQDCYAFGDWAEVIQCGDFTVGRNSRMPCEQSLFFIRHGSILRVITDYMNIRESDQFMSTEEKFMRCGATFHALGCGRDRPLTPGTLPWYAQKLTQEEINEHCNSGLV